MNFAAIRTLNTKTIMWLNILHSFLFKAVIYYGVLTARHEIVQFPLFHIFAHIISATWSLLKIQTIKLHLFKQNRDCM